MTKKNKEQELKLQMHSAYSGSDIAMTSQTRRIAERKQLEQKKQEATQGKIGNSVKYDSSLVRGSSYLR